jgi:hypothetical protein
MIYTAGTIAGIDWLRAQFTSGMPLPDVAGSGWYAANGGTPQDLQNVVNLAAELKTQFPGTKFGFFEGGVGQDTAYTCGYYAAVPGTVWQQGGYFLGAWAAHGLWGNSDAPLAFWTTCGADTEAAPILDLLNMSVQSYASTCFDYFVPSVGWHDCINEGCAGGLTRFPTMPENRTYPGPTMRGECLATGVFNGF